MASSLNIPRTVLAAGVRNFPASGGVSVPDADVSILLSIDRTTNGGLNSAAVTTTLEIETYQSGDAGATWQNLAAATAAGGIYTSNHGTQLNTFDVLTTLNPGTSRLVRAVTTVTGASVAVAGTLSTT